MKKRQEVEKAPNSERWLLTYSDLITLLLIFFIVMYTISSVNADKFKQVSSSLTSAFSVMSGSKYIVGTNSSPSMIPGESGMNMPTPEEISRAQEEASFQAVAEEINKLAGDKGMGGIISATQEERGIAVDLNEAALFDEGSAVLSQAAINNIADVGRIILKSCPTNHVRVEGYTDNTPISTSQFPSNWELSSARANSVRKILIENVGFSPANLSMTGYGEYRPIAPNDSPATKAKNRRVVIAIIRSEFNQLEPGNPLKSKQP